MFEKNCCLETIDAIKVHLHADHVMLRDGKDFCCPKKQCDKVYPSRENLRQHIAAHYHGAVVASLPGFDSSFPLLKKKIRLGNFFVFFHYRIIQLREIKLHNCLYAS